MYRLLASACSWAQAYSHFSAGASGSAFSNPVAKLLVVEFRAVTIPSGITRKQDKVMSSLDKVILSVRPAILGTVIAGALGRNRRRVLDHAQGRFWIDPTSDFGFRLSNGEYEPSMREWIERLLGPGKTFLDLGANEGYFSIIASRIVGSRGRVWCLEPQTRLLPVIHKNIQLNLAYNVQVTQVAVSNRTETLELSLAPSTNSGSSSLSRQTLYPVPKQEIQSTTLADLFNRGGIGEVDVIKIDIEGAEALVLPSSKELFATGRIRTAVVEFHESQLVKSRSSTAELVELMKGCGFQHRNEGEPNVFVHRSAKVSV